MWRAQNVLNTQNLSSQINVFCCQLVKLTRLPCTKNTPLCVQVWQKCLPFPSMCPKVRSLSGMRTSCSLVFKSSLMPKLSTRGSTILQMNTYTESYSSAITVFVFIMAIVLSIAHTCVFWKLQALPVEGSCCSEWHHSFHPWWLECRSARENIILANMHNISQKIKNTLVLMSASHSLWLHLLTISLFLARIAYPNWDSLLLRCTRTISRSPRTVATSSPKSRPTHMCPLWDWAWTTEITIHRESYSTIKC